MRVAKLARPGLRIMALTSSPERKNDFRQAGITPLMGNLDQPESLYRLAGLSHRLLHLAPPPGDGWCDQRTRALTLSLRGRGKPQKMVYGSTSGVYGNCHGNWVSEQNRPNPFTPRAIRRVDAEKAVRHFCRSSGTLVSILRIPGIYSPDRPSGTPYERLKKATPVLQAQDDVYTNHIHADDLARACWLALWRGKTMQCININDDTQLKMGDYFDLAAQLFQLPKPPRVSRQLAQNQLPLMLLSFMGESRRMVNRRMKQVLGLKLRYPGVREGLLSAARI